MREGLTGRRVRSLARRAHERRHHDLLPENESGRALVGSRGRLLQMISPSWRAE